MFMSGQHNLICSSVHTASVQFEAQELQVAHLLFLFMFALPAEL